MTTYQFVPSTSSAFNFQPTLDGQQYNVIVAWNLFGQRYYVNCYTLVGGLVFSLPLIGSLNAISLQSLSWDYARQTVTATTILPHNFLLGQLVDVTISGCTPTAYNGMYPAIVNGKNSFTYPLAADPGSPVTLGTAAYNINLAAGYFSTSTLVYRVQNQTFEVVP
jgi:hypothetical protein